MAGAAAATGFKAAMTAAAPYISAASVGMSALGAIQQGNAANAAAQTNAALMNRQARREAEIGALNAKRQRAAGEKLAGTQRALLAGGGGDQSTGSALLLQEGLAQESEFNARLAESNAEEAIFAKQAEAVLARAEGRNAKTSSMFRAGTALLKGGTAAFG